MTSISKTQNYIKGVIFDIIIDNLVDEELLKSFEDGFDSTISREKHENILSIANDLIDKIEQIGFVRFYGHLIKALESFKDEDLKIQELYWQDFDN